MAKEERFWKWCGLKKRERDTVSGLFNGYEWIDSRGRILFHGENFPITLNNLFKYAAPLAYERLSKDGEGYKMKRVYLALENAIRDGKDPALAVFKVLDKVREEER